MKRTGVEIDIKPDEFTEERADKSIQEGNGMVRNIKQGVKGVKGEKEKGKVMVTEMVVGLVMVPEVWKKRKYIKHDTLLESKKRKFNEEKLGKD